MLRPCASHTVHGAPSRQGAPTNQAFEKKDHINYSNNICIIKNVQIYLIVSNTIRKQSKRKKMTVFLASPLVPLNFSPTPPTHIALFH